MRERQPAVYILASARRGTLYIGVTADLRKRVWQHRNDLVEGFTKTYGVHTLVYFEMHATMAGAITREKEVKKWKRVWKLMLIAGNNPEWKDLWTDILPWPSFPRKRESKCRLGQHSRRKPKMDSRLRGNDGENGFPLARE